MKYEKYETEIFLGRLLKILKFKLSNWVRPNLKENENFKRIVFYLSCKIVVLHISKTMQKI